MTQLASPGPTRTRSGRALSRVPVSAISLCAGVVLWEIVGRIADVRFFPPFSVVLHTLWEMTTSGQIVGNLMTSLGNLTVGFGISLLIGLVVGTAMGRYRRVNAALSVYVYALLTAPSLVFAPIFFSIFGAGQPAIVAVVVMYSTFVMIITTASAVSHVPHSMIEMGRSFGGNEWQLVTRIVLPAATPSIMAGVRIGMGRAVLGMINGEMFIAIVGLGRIVNQAGGRFDGAAVLAVLIVIILVALGAVGIVQLADRRLTSWLATDGEILRISIAARLRDPRPRHSSGDGALAEDSERLAHKVVAHGDLRAAVHGPLVADNIGNDPYRRFALDGDQRRARGLGGDRIVAVGEALDGEFGFREFHRLHLETRVPRCLGGRSATIG